MTQAFSASTAYGEIDLAIRQARRRRGEIGRGVHDLGDEGPGLTPDADVAATACRGREQRGAAGFSRGGCGGRAITRAENPAGESSLGNLIADAQRIQTSAQFAFMNPGGIRADLAAGEVTWGELFTIQPFSNDLVNMDLTGAQIDCCSSSNG